MSNLPPPDSLRTDSNIPVIAIGRAVEHESRKWLRYDLTLRIVNFLFAFVLVFLTSFAVIGDTIAISCVLILVSLEVATQFFIESKASALQSLSRRILQREMYVAAGYVSDDSLGTVRLRGEASNAIRNVKEIAKEWQESRIRKGCKPDGSDFHSTRETEEDVRLLDILYENFSWWAELSKVTAKRYQFAMFGAFVFTVIGLVTVAVLVDERMARLHFVLAFIQSLLLFSALRIVQDFRRWNSAAQDFDRKRVELSRVVECDDLEPGELHNFVVDYSVLTRSVAPAPASVVEWQYAALDLQVQQELRAREEQRKRNENQSQLQDSPD